MIFTRNLQPQLEKEITSDYIIVLTGMRRSGKTTLLRAVFDKIESKNKVFLDLENPLNQKFFEETNFDNILSNLRSLGLLPEERMFLFLDEIQVMPSIVRAIKYLHDHYKIKFFVTGSASFYLKNLFPESLAGRKMVYELFPLTFNEFLIFRGREKIFHSNFDDKVKNGSDFILEQYRGIYEEYLSYGGFPQVVLESVIERKKQILGEIFTSYFEKDVRSLTDFKKIAVFRDLIALLASRVGSRLDVSKLAKELGVSRQTIYEYIYFLKETYFVFLLPSFSHNMDRVIRGAKKVYFCDNGLLGHLYQPDPGILLENSVYNQLKPYGELAYYTKGKKEIDFILNKKFAFEVKVRADFRDQKNLAFLSKPLRIEKFYVISREHSTTTDLILAMDL
ncbi:MAG: Uncharacterized protein G01um101418_475 [Parcubacteria group bacterium Gr01-1014_18]|nr:MAG: Uncharacterized protein Greene041636_521 [Parcubacteria group bacterium Greene0416_36]TSC81062.1 MAG: Uncharacterized protein G01um101418_475 [Parcubacteria group bacterium Gr01-1014_18]TSC98796.1 MAG: Uncharacterized protein Greene101420_546 [Parcubacteria group bacterium Greene1014_20]TSD06724.1 MAG: Uncharacterized protein Greene07142_645 [Parcubacteria group bacterium Greene0714_2]